MKVDKLDGKSEGQMKYQYGSDVYDVRLVDDGTLDTVLLINGLHEVRFDTDYARTSEGGIEERAITDAIEDFLESLEAKTVQS